MYVTDFPMTFFFSKLYCDVKQMHKQTCFLGIFSAFNALLTAKYDFGNVLESAAQYSGQQKNTHSLTDVKNHASVSWDIKHV